MQDGGRFGDNQFTGRYRNLLFVDNRISGNYLWAILVKRSVAGLKILKNKNRYYETAHFFDHYYYYNNAVLWMLITKPGKTKQ